MPSGIMIIIFQLLPVLHQQLWAFHETSHKEQFSKMPREVFFYTQAAKVPSTLGMADRMIPPSWREKSSRVDKTR